MKTQIRTNALKRTLKELRPVCTSDIDAMSVIFNETANTGANSPVTRPITTKELGFYVNLYQNDNLPVYVLECQGEIVGWLSVNRFSWGTLACRLTGEISVYVRSDYYGSGLGVRLTLASILLGRAYGMETMVAWIMASNLASQKIVQHLGGEQWAFLPNIARFKDKHASVVLFGFRPDLEL